MTKNKYQLVVQGYLRRTIAVENVNREVVLKDMCIWAKENCHYQSKGEQGKILPSPYRIYVTENGNRELLLYSVNRNHAKFIEELCQPEANM